MRERRKRALWTESICSPKKRSSLCSHQSHLSLQSTPWQLAHTLDPLQGGWPKLGFHPSPGRCQQCQGCQVEICSKELHFRSLVGSLPTKKTFSYSPLYNNIILNILSKIYVSLCWKMLENCEPNYLASRPPLPQLFQHFSGASMNIAFLYSRKMA